MKNFFISYNKADCQWAEWVAWTLEEEGYSTVLQAWDFRPGCNFVLEMDKASKETERTILLLSPDFLNSSFAAPEWAAAFVEDPTGRKTKLLPIEVRDCRPEGLLSSINHINLVGLNALDAKQTLLNGLSHERSKPKSQPIFPGQRSVSEQPFFPGELLVRGDLPVGSRLPFPPNAVFTGREKDLIELSSTLLYSNAIGTGVTQKAAVTTGLGGIGKTQLAVEFCYRYGRFFQGVHWIHADQDIPAEIAACGLAMVLPNWPDKLPEQVALTLKTWHLGKPHLVIMDGVVDPSMVLEWMPQLSCCRLLLTSRRVEWPPDLGLKTWPLDVLHRSQSKELLCKLAPRLGNVPDKGLDEIADRLGDLPLALDLAGRYLAERPGLSLEGYLKALNNAGNALKHSSLKVWVKYSPTKHATNLAATFSLSWDQLSGNEVDRLARRIFKVCGYCAPNTPIPLDLLKETMISDEMLDMAISRLTCLGLIIPADSGPSLHPLLAEFARIQDKEGEESILPFLSDALVRLTNHAMGFGLLEQMKLLREHLQSTALAEDTVNPQMAWSLWTNLGIHQMIISEFDDAKRSHEKALDVAGKAYGSHSIQVAGSLDNLGNILRYIGGLPNLKRAKDLQEQSLEIFNEVYGPYDTEVAKALDNLASVLQELGELKEAKKKRERALEIFMNINGLYDPDTAQVLNNSGTLLADLGDLQGAVEKVKLALEIKEKIYGKDNIELLSSIHNLGTFMNDLGEVQNARKYFEFALEINKKHFGEDHPYTKWVHNTLDSLKA